VASDGSGAHADLRDLLLLLLDRAVHPRTGRPLTRARIAQNAGISSGYLSDVLSGKRSPRPDTARRLAQAMRADEAEAQRAYDLAESLQTTARRDRIARRVKVPRLLKAAPTGFLGRPNDLAHLSRLADVAGRARQRRTVSLITGQPGVGKTWFVLHWAQQRLTKWPAGQLYADLREFASITDVLHRFLFALGVPSRATTADLGDLTTLYREVTADRQLLVILDNVTGLDEIEPLLPGDGPHTVVVTSRNRLHTLLSAHNAGTMHLDVLTDQESRAILIARAGAARAESEPDAFATLIAMCAGLPYALSLVGARAALHPGWPLSQVVDLVRSRRPAGGRDAVLDLAAIFRSGYDSFPPEVRHALRMLGLGVDAEIGLTSAAALLGRAEPETYDLLIQLNDASYLEQPAYGRFRMHELMRAFAAERAEAEETPDDREAARRRLAESLLYSAYLGELQLSPDRPQIGVAEPAPGLACFRPRSEREALEWFDSHETDLLTTQRVAAEHGWHAIVWQVAWSLDDYRYRRGLLAGHAATWVRGLAAATVAADPEAQALARLSLGNIRARQGRRAEAVGLLEPAREHYESTGDLMNLAQVHRALGFAHAAAADLQRELVHVERALALFTRMGRTRWVAIELSALGEIHARLGDLVSARHFCEQALDLHRQQGNRSGEAATLDSLGVVAEAEGDLDRAARSYLDSAAIYHDIGNVASEADTLFRRGKVLMALPAGAEEGRAVLRRALDMFTAQFRPESAAEVEAYLELR
jgi:tetratricopeptide (TPR) repeat protein/transcriptional regulator with XRE-family HTH domain